MKFLLAAALVLAGSAAAAATTCPCVSQLISIYLNDPVNELIN